MTDLCCRTSSIFMIHILIFNQHNNDFGLFLVYNILFYCFIVAVLICECFTICKMWTHAIKNKIKFCVGVMFCMCMFNYKYQKYLQKRRYIKRLRRWGYSNKFIRWQVNHPNYNDRNKYIHKKHLNHNNNQNKTLFLVKKYNVNLDDRKLLNDLIMKHIKAANLLKDNKIMICNKTGDNLQTIINKSYWKDQNQD